MRMAATEPLFNAFHRIHTDYSRFWLENPVNEPVRGEAFTNERHEGVF